MRVNNRERSIYASRLSGAIWRHATAAPWWRRYSMPEDVAAAIAEAPTDEQRMRVAAQSLDDRQLRSIPNLGAKGVSFLRQEFGEVVVP